MKLRTWITLIVIALVLVGAGFWLNWAVANKEQQEQVTNPISTSTDNTTDTGQASTSAPIVVPTPSATSTPGANWVTGTNSGQGYQVQYPPDLSTNQNGDILTLTFPKQIYFHWPLQDEAYISVIASSTCPDMLVGPGLPVSTSTFTLNGYSFTATEGNDVAAGNRYQEITYETRQGNVCYQLNLFDHGSNGAGLYVGDQSLIQQYDAQHDADMANITDVFERVANSLRTVNK